MIPMMYTMYLVTFAMFIAGAYGWFQNLFKVVSMVGTTDMTAELLIRIAGVPVVFLGAIAGWF